MQSVMSLAVVSARRIIITHFKNFKFGNINQTLLLFRRIQKSRINWIKLQIKAPTIRNFIFLQSFLGISVSEKNTKNIQKMSDVEMKNLNELILHADQLFDENKFAETIELIKGYEKQDLYEIKWRLARAVYKQSQCESGKKADEMVREAYGYAEEALKLNDNDYAGHKWYAVLLDRKSELDGTKERISQLETFHNHIKRALELNPQDATTWYILGEYYYGLADLNWMTRKIVQVVFATPPTATYEQALECFEKAETISPDFFSKNKLSIGKVYLKLANKEKAKEFLTKAANVNVLNEDDKQCKEEATNLLKKL